MLFLVNIDTDKIIAFLRIAGGLKEIERFLNTN